MIALKLKRLALYFGIGCLSALFISPGIASNNQSSEIAKIEALLPTLTTQINKMLQDSHTPGVAVGIIYEDKVIFAQGFGVKDLETKQAINADTRFLIGSVSKSMTGSVLAKLVSQGKMKWDDKVIQYLPNFKLYDPWVTKEITLRDLLSHRSGLPTHTADILEQLGYNREEIIERLYLVKPTTSFRSHWDYQNSLFTVAGEAAAKAVGKNWGDVIKQTLFQPLGMNSSSANIADFLQAENKITPYHLVNNTPQKITVAINDTFAPSGGVSTTLNDINRWMIMQLNQGKYQGRQFIQSDVLNETHAPQIVTSKNSLYSDKYSFYSLGMVVEYDDQGNTYLQHSGALDGIRSCIVFIPEKKVGIVVLANAFPNALPEAIAHTFFDLYFYNTIKRDWLDYENKSFAELLNSLAAKPTKLPTKKLTNKPTLPLTAYKGLYYNDYLGDLHITEEQGKLVLELLTPRPMKFVLEPWNGDQFAIQHDGETNIVKFKIIDSKVVAVILDGFTKDVEPIFQHTS